MRKLASSYVVRYPEYFDKVESEIVAKGYFADLSVETGDATYSPTFYDPVRLAQEVEDSLRHGSCYFEDNLVVLRSVDRQNIDAAVRWLASHNFQGLVPDESS